MSILRPLLLMVVAAAITLTSVARAETYAFDEQGRRMRVEFDPASRVRIGVLSGATQAQGSTHQATAVEAGIAWRSIARSGKHGDEVRWQLDHRFFWGQVMPWTEAAGKLRPMDATAYSGTWLRHADASYLMLPTDPPRNVYFPLDIGVDMEAGRFRIAPSSSDQQVLRIGAARAAVLLDPLRSNRTGNSLEFGVGVRYDIDLAGSPTLQHPATVHRLAPFTATSLRWRWQDRPGLTCAELYATWYPHWSSEGAWTTRAAEGRGRFERVLVALNDQPVAFVIDATYAKNPPLNNVEVKDEFRLQAGLSLGLQLK